MCPTMIPRGAAPIMVAVALLLTSARVAGSEEDRANPVATPGATAADLLVARPGGLVATVLGTAVFVVGLPFTLINGSTEQAAQQLVVKPANYTFSRPLGQEIGGLGNP
ncbi:MAG: hypothetical protein RKR03_01110 [Candidatus Competibacter sp.]|nr:hypothetical protein [Candidatus Competibacter sp.]